MLQPLQKSTLINDILVIRLEQQNAAFSQRKNQIREVLNLFVSQKKKFSEKNRKTSFNFNPLLKIPITETTHSRVIGDLLNPKGTHGQGNLFLNGFLRMINIHDPESGRWHQSIELGRIDICLWRLDPPNTVIIENKSNWAMDQPHQLYRYWLEAIHKYHPDLDYSTSETMSRYKIVYLTPRRTKRPSPTSLKRPDGLHHEENLPSTLPLEPEIFTLDQDVKRWIDSCVGKLDSENVRLRSFLNMYLEIWH